MKLVAICCENSGWKALESIRDRAPLKAVEAVKAPCAGRVEIGELLKLFEAGADRVLVAGCPVDNCKYVKGNCRALKRVEAARRALEDAGLDGKRLRMELVSSVDGHRLAAVLKEMQE